MALEKPFDIDVASLETQSTGEMLSATVKRLSFPPRGQLQLRSSTTGMEPSSPVKRLDHSISAESMSAALSYAYHTTSKANDGAQREREDIIGTPSPAKAGRGTVERAATLPSTRATEGSVRMLRGVIANALKRREGSGSGSVDSA